MSAARVVSAPDCSVAGKKVDTGAEAKCFGDYMRIHTLEATGGATYAQMPRFATDDGKGTNDEAAATKGPDGAPAPNQAATSGSTRPPCPTPCTPPSSPKGSRCSR